MASGGNIGFEFLILGRHGSTVGPMTMTWTDDNDVAINLTGATFESKIFESRTSEDVIGSFDISVVSASAGKFSIQISYQDSELLPRKGPLYYTIDVLMGGQKIPLLFGQLELSKG